MKVERAREFFEAAGSADKTWVPHEGLFHETLNEIDWQPVAGAVADWVLGAQVGQEGAILAATCFLRDGRTDA